MDDYDYCYECQAYGDDYLLNENGEWEDACSRCPMNLDDWEEWIEE